MSKLCFAILFLLLHHAESANILVVCPFFGKSHSVFILPIISGLADKGHNITLITTNLINDAPENLRQIQPYPDPKILDVDINLILTFDSIPAYLQVYFIWGLAMEKGTEYIESPAMQKFLKEDDSQYDLVIAEAFFLEMYYAFAHKYQAPLVILGTLTYWETIGQLVGNPSMMSYLSYEFYRYAGDLDILQRTNNYALYLYSKYLYRWHIYPKHDRLIKKHFGESYPSVEELEKNISLVLFNTHFSIDEVRPLVPGIVEVAGVHLKPPKELPNDLKMFLDGATNGFIYFSLGSNLKSTLLPKDKLDAILKVFAKLKQRVLWKWEDDDKPELPGNVMTMKWFPQLDVLAHPKIRMFVTHCGMLSTQDAINSAVPILGIPFFGDQHLNIAKIERTGMAYHLPFSKLTEETLLAAINEVLNNPKYGTMAKEVSARFRDRMNTPLETSVYWIEYVIRHRGAAFMKSKLTNTPWFQYYLIDVYAVMLFIASLILYVSFTFCKISFRLCKANVSKKRRDDKKNN